MTEYTPTTNEVREGYQSYIISGKSVDEKRAEFDRWLSELIRKEREEAWDEGFSLATRNTIHNPHPMAEMNPYRKE